MTARPPIGSRRNITVGEDKLTADERRMTTICRSQPMHREWVAIVDRLAPEPPRRTLETVTLDRAVRAAWDGKDVWRAGGRLRVDVAEMIAEDVRNHNSAMWYEIEVPE